MAMNFLASIIMNFFQSLWVFPKGNCGNKGAWWQLFQSILFVCILHWSFFSVSYRNGKREGYFLTKKVTACCKVYRHSSKYYVSIDILDMHAFWSALSCSQQESNIEWEIDNILCQFWQTDWYAKFSIDTIINVLLLLCHISTCVFKVQICQLGGFMFVLCVCFEVNHWLL